MKNRTFVLLVVMVFTPMFCQQARADQTIFQPTTYAVPSSLTIDVGVPLTGTWDFSGATVTGLPAAPVTSVFTRTGAVVATSGDYSAAQVTNAVSTASTYANPTWLTALAWSKITGAPAFLTGNQTITLSGDATGSGATSIAVTIPGKGNWDTAYTDRLKWDGGATGLVAATGRTSLGLVIGTNVEAWDADLDAIAALAGTSGLARKTAANTWSLDTATYLTGNQTITLTGDATGSGATAITTTVAAKLPVGGTSGQILTKNSATNYDASWASPAGGGNVSNVGTPTSGQIAQWTAATTIQGVSTLPTTVGALPTGGTTGQVLSKNSATNYDTGWSTAAPPTKVILLTSGTSYTRSTGARALFVECVGGGGSGGSALAAASNCSAGSGGGGGGYAAVYLSGTLKSSYSYVIGAGGAGAGNTDGTDTTFDSPSVCTATGGSKGLAGLSSTAAAWSPSGGVAGSGATGDILLSGEAGQQGNRLSGTQGKGGDGGESPQGFGMGARGHYQQLTGISAPAGYGGGGAGALSTTATSFWGGSGAAGCIRITEYF
jgi:hypothetical protein